MSHPIDPQAYYLEKIAEYDQKFAHLCEMYQAYSNDSDCSALVHAYEFAKEAHKDQRRATGEPYIMHPLATAEILLGIRVDKICLIAAILHDTVEDTEVTQEEIDTVFGTVVGKLVGAVTKMSSFQYTGNNYTDAKLEVQVDTFRRLFLHMAEDKRVILIKLADRLHNMRTMKYIDPKKRKRKAEETLKIFAPIADRLGIYRLKWELEDLSFRFLEPEAYLSLVSEIAENRSSRERFLQDIVADMQAHFNKMGLKVEIETRPKHFYSIYRKMLKDQVTIEGIYDLLACRVLVDSVQDCYNVLGKVHEIYQPMPGRFKDYIAMPKPNGYKSLHTTVLGRHSTPFEVQIRTHEMHRVADFGIAAHWQYKENGRRSSEQFDERMAWFRQFNELPEQSKEASDYWSTVTGTLGQEEIFVYTPRNDLVALPQGSVSIDLAYHIHSDIGNTMVAARVNSVLKPLEYVLKNEDRVEIICSDSAPGPSYDWLQLVKSNSAKSKIRSWLKRSMRGANIIRGKELIEREIQKTGFRSKQLLRKEFIQPVLDRYSFQEPDLLYAAIGYGGLSVNRVIPRLRDAFLLSLTPEEREKRGYYVKDNGQLAELPLAYYSQNDPDVQKEREKQVAQRGQKQSKNIGIKVKGVDNCLVKLGRCCNPIPGNAIVGFITRGDGVTVHRVDCSNIVHIRKAALEGAPKSQERASRLIDVSWGDEDAEKSYEVKLSVYARDRKALVFDITKVIIEEEISLVSVRTLSSKLVNVTLNLWVVVSNKAQLDRLCARIRSVHSVHAVKHG